jgi:hypothetical protein
MVLPGYVRQSGPDPVNPTDLATKNYVDTVVVKASCRYGLTAWTTSATPMTAQIVPFNILVYDDAGAYNTTTGLFTCPYPGIYMLAGQFGANPATGVQVNRYVYKNGAVVRTSAANTSGYNEMPIVFTDRCVAGDTLGLALAVNVASFAIRTGGETGLDIVRIGP